MDTLKFICAVFVILLHTPQPEIWAQYINPVIECAVPVFFMMSGYFTFGKNCLDSIIRRRILSQLKIFGIAFFFYFTIFVVVNGQDSLENVNKLFSISFIVFNSIPYGMHLWYIAAYIYVLLVILLIDRFHLYRVLYCMTPFLFLAAMWLGKYSGILLGAHFHPCYVRNWLFVGLPFVTLGMLLKQMNPPKRLFPNIVLCAILYVLSLLEISRVNGFSGYYLSTIFLSVSIFCLFLNIKQTEDNLFSRIGREDGLYIYVFHFIIATAITMLCEKEPVLCYVSALLVFILTLMFVSLLRKIKIIGKVI